MMSKSWIPTEYIGNWPSVCLAPTNGFRPLRNLGINYQQNPFTLGPYVSTYTLVYTSFPLTTSSQTVG
jgi:hypothetical protein